MWTRQSAEGRLTMFAISACPYTHYLVKGCQYMWFTGSLWFDGRLINCQTPDDEYLILLDGWVMSFYMACIYTPDVIQQQIINWGREK